MSFQSTLIEVLKHEGGYANNPVDSGGATFRGVARNFNQGWPGWPLIDAAKRDGNTTATAINRFFDGHQEMEKFVANLYWRPTRGATARFTARERPVSKMFEAGVNIGPKNAIQIAQAIVGVVTDGVIGPKTLAAVTSYFAQPGMEDIFISEFCYRQLDRYIGIVLNNQSQIVFLRGWRARAAWKPPKAAV